MPQYTVGVTQEFMGEVDSYGYLVLGLDVPDSDGFPYQSMVEASKAGHAAAEAFIKANSDPNDN